MSANVYDLETGAPRTSEIEDSQKAADAEAEQEIVDVVNMLKSPGWARIDKWLQNEVKSLYSELLHASEPTMIIRIQQKIMAIEGIVNTIKSFEEESKLLAEQRNGSRT